MVVGWKQVGYLGRRCAENSKIPKILCLVSSQYLVTAGYLFLARLPPLPFVRYLTFGILPQSTKCEKGLKATSNNPAGQVKPSHRFNMHEPKVSAESH